MRLKAKIHTQDKGQIDFELRDYQDRILQKYETGKSVLTLASRQSGISSVIAYYIANKVLQEDNLSVIIYGKRREFSKELLNKIKDTGIIHKDYIKRDNMFDLKLNNSSEIVALSARMEPTITNKKNIIVLECIDHWSDNTIEDVIASTVQNQPCQMIYTANSDGFNILKKIPKYELLIDTVSWYEHLSYDQLHNFQKLINEGDFKKEFSTSW